MATGPLVLAGSKFEFQTRQMPLMLNFCFRKFMHNRPPVDVKMKIKTKNINIDGTSSNISNNLD